VNWNELRKPTKYPVRTCSLRAEERTWDLPKTEQC